MFKVRELSGNFELNGHSHDVHMLVIGDGISDTIFFVVQSICCVSEHVALRNDLRSRGQMISLLHQTFFTQIRCFFLAATNRLCFAID